MLPRGPGGAVLLGAEAPAEASVVHNPEHDALIQVRYEGRLDFAAGTIDATDITPEQFIEKLKFIGSEGLILVPDLSQLHGGCMDGRGNALTIAGNPVAPRPKVIGGPSLFTWYLASIGNFSILEGIDDPLEQFKKVNEVLMEADFKLGMHVECGAARGIVPILECYRENYDGITSFVGDEAEAHIAENPDIITSGIKRGIEITGNSAADSPGFNEQAMHKVVSDLNGMDAIIRLASDPEHENKGHEEEGLAFIRVDNAIVNKDKVVEKYGHKLFYQNAVYAARLIRAIARTDEEIKLGTVIGDQLAIAGCATLGKNQHVGEIVGAIR